MSESLFPPFFKWGEYSSKDKQSPDEIEIVPQELETFETEYSINVRVLADGEEKILPLQSFESKNKQLHSLWIENRRKGKIKEGKKFKLLTWLGLSKNKFPIRRFEMVF